MSDWFAVDRRGLRKLLEARGVRFVLWELIANAWDAPGTTRVDVQLDPVPGDAKARVLVLDDSPQGFANLEHAWTLFAESNRKADALKRGRWNLGEKLVLAMCSEAKIVTTTGGVRFDSDGRHRLRERSVGGSEFAAILRCSREQYTEMADAVLMVQPPAGVALTFNGVKVRDFERLRRFSAELPTEYADEEGVLRRSRRIAQVELLAPVLGGTGWVYELGIPVVATGDKWHYNVLQKVPLTTDRTNVTPGFLHELRVAVLNNAYEEVAGPEANTAPWVRDAASDKHANLAAVQHVLEQRFGDKAVAYDPSDPEGTKIAVTQGYTVVSGGSLSAGEWENARRAGALPPAGQVTPSPKPFTPGGDPLKLIPREKWTPEMHTRECELKHLAMKLLGHSIQVFYTTDIGWSYKAAYGGEILTVNLGHLGKAWCSDPLVSDQVLPLALHELAHDLVADHLSRDYQNACCKLGAAAVRLALEDPGSLKREVTP